ncbi:polar amino acid transport system substrate-binding protein [Actinopolymorpha cephalotaxi]|uniref:Polar amino acid transport system substrate-binding protein n=1 Tax=Actinopolymorpha cephalotaxi TaxID=504797 RepID=A0A1I2NTM9_9ACTN|nr:ABC transporter substrate-binding protein [Actinopolymorpha cephalotaxi]NYH85443.1 polar amino acid transport system substrate-binding protein [Actinopolymorpha cephalotaxi]SFG04987.1 polar amino acid transport system substrate-binding protein [Actinopolymorpha cephalotaxi]
MPTATWSPAHTSRRGPRHRLAVLVSALACAVLAALTACAPEDSATGGQAGGTPTKSAKATGSATPTADGCAKSDLDLHTPGTLTVATDQPAYEPWFADDNPTSGKGFESAVAYAVARKLGFAASEVTWTRVRFNNAIQPGPKDFDFDINEFTITDQRKKAVDFSSSYYDATQAVVALKSAPIAKAKSVPDLKDAKLGAQVNTTSYDVINDVVQPSKQAQVFRSNDDARQALSNGSIDGLVVDLPTAFYMTAAQLENATIVGQLKQKSGTPEQFGLVLDKGSPLTACVTRAVDALRTDGTLDELAKTWLADVAGAPVLN